MDFLRAAVINTYQKCCRDGETINLFCQRFDGQRALIPNEGKCYALFFKTLYTRAFGDGPRNLNHGQVTWTTPELLLTTTPHQREDVSALDRFNVHRCPTRRVFSYWRARTCDKASHSPIPIPLGYRGHKATATAKCAMRILVAQLGEFKSMSTSAVRLSKRI
ncbi:hypothetical protein TNCV_5046281 [Trichonephila clavipes]|uniref:Uncharacterized protein n=1 Tax=Trichonephila clavipes TaxID=2585209 RepID=A0A8X7BM40_TRICX|nr:hypothetical protein TNCV_5046281 [Trichonephila clavipes]